MATQTVAKLEARSHDSPDETRTPAKTKVEVVKLGDVTVGRLTFEPGWAWSECIKPVAGTEHCEATHTSYAVAGELEVWMVTGDRTRIRAGDSYTIPPGHDAKVVGEEPFVGIEWSSAATYATK
ncbi:MAG: cupin domain-containing protein [Candidatus Dormiibacterota bacterium]